MIYTTNNILMPHRPSRGAISRVALLAAYSRAVPKLSPACTVSVHEFQCDPAGILAKAYIVELPGDAQHKTKCDQYGSCMWFVQKAAKRYEFDLGAA
ncbi:hypothetical protein T265_09017 [Opisthorchis viverrini]|uniref:Uncharacterized protein n=1 Tax=Opisthorchis viverrini TaxID=6198 RepID=A0A074ZBM3_OPIVI|nr:hypothetical protein T265_09017 [Opisthorchis viverrini]KER23007.1 hypothetical protein T265_09017 [Opisthorchis viverrini]